jgi:hypothetical protein
MKKKINPSIFLATLLESSTKIWRFFFLTFGEIMAIKNLKTHLIFTLLYSFLGYSIKQAKKKGLSAFFLAGYICSQNAIIKIRKSAKNMCFLRFSIDII